MPRIQKPGGLPMNSTPDMCGDIPRAVLSAEEAAASIEESCEK